MSKKNADREKEEEKDLDEEEEDDETEDDEDEAPRPAAKVVAGKARPRPRAAAADARAVVRSKASDHDDHGHADDDEEEEDSDEEEDAYWWTPHAVMSALVLLGVLGFFGVFNKVLAGIAAHPAAAATAEKAPEKSAASESHASPTPGPNRAQQGEEFGAKHLLVQYKGSMRAAPTVTRTDDEAKARATEALKKAKSGAKFEDLVKEYSDEPGAGARGGDLGKFRKGRMDPVFQAAVEKLKVGEVSDLVKTQFGYHIIMRTQ
jgi:parvulin-like peptidyl-prolyl isomerase